MTEISLLAILVAGVANVAIGAMWYHPRVFGTVWMRLNTITPESAEKGKRRMPLNSVVAFLAGVLIAWVMNMLGVALGIFDWIGAVFQLALWCWLGFVVPTMLGQVLWDHKPIRVYLINVSYWLVSFVVMALILIF